jgi:hypothetical protein
MAPTIRVRRTVAIVSMRSECKEKVLQSAVTLRGRADYSSNSALLTGGAPIYADRQVSSMVTVQTSNCAQSKK